VPAAGVPLASPAPSGAVVDGGGPTGGSGCIALGSITMTGSGDGFIVAVGTWRGFVRLPGAVSSSSSPPPQAARASAAMRARIRERVVVWGVIR